MKSQIATLTANSDHNETQSWITNPGLLQRQLIKQQQAMKVERWKEGREEGKGGKR